MSAENTDVTVKEPPIERNLKPAENIPPPKPNAAMPKAFSLSPKDLTEAMNFAKMMSESSLVPKNYQGKDKAADCLIAMHYANVLGLDVLQAMPDIAVINGRPGIFGTLGKALLRRHGFKIEERDIDDIKKLQQARCVITRPDNGEKIERTFSLDNAKDAKLWGKEGPWTTYPWRQMAWRAFWFAARDGAGDVLRGMWGIEELRDYVDTTATSAADDDAPQEIEPPPVEPTPQNPVVDVQGVRLTPKNCIDDMDRKALIALINKQWSDISPDERIETLKTYLREELGITDEKYPTSYIPKEDLARVRDWIVRRKPDAQA